MNRRMPNGTSAWCGRTAGVIPPPTRSVLASVVVAGLAQEPQSIPAQPDPAGIRTGDKNSITDANGDSFVVSPPSPTDPDHDKKEALFQEYQRQAAAEPLAGKLADSVGHIRVATNFAWTLNTGYLVLFMQAGFALLTCGLVRKKNAGHLMMLNFAAYVFAFLAYYAVGFAFQFGAVAINNAPGTLGGTPTLNHFIVGGQSWGLLGGKGFFLSGPAYDAGSNCLTLFEVVFMETAAYIIVGAICEPLWNLLKAFKLESQPPDQATFSALAAVMMSASDNDPAGQRTDPFFSGNRSSPLATPASIYSRTSSVLADTTTGEHPMPSRGVILLFSASILIVASAQSGIAGRPSR